MLHFFIIKKVILLKKIKFVVRAVNKIYEIDS